MRKNHRIKWAALPIGIAAALVLAGCTAQELNGFMPGATGTSDIGDRIANFWVNSWIALMGVGLLTWGLILWATIAYRRRKNDTLAPPQMRYHMPIEIMFTVIPVVLIGAFAALTIRETDATTQNYVADGTVPAEQQMDVHIEVYGKQWAWDFNYLPVEGSDYDADVYYTGVQAVQDLGDDGKTNGLVDMDQLPVLYIPVDAKITIDLKSRDVAHSFWIPAFHYKEDTIPGKTNQFSFVAGAEGEYIGKCAELCGEYHSMMLFKVEVVSQAEYNAYIQSLHDAGQTGRRGDEYNRNNQDPGTKVPVIEEEEN